MPVRRARLAILAICTIAVVIDAVPTDVRSPRMHAIIAVIAVSPTRQLRRLPIPIDVHQIEAIEILVDPVIGHLYRCGRRHHCPSKQPHVHLRGPRAAPVPCGQAALPRHRGQPCDQKRQNPP